jgi:hypothetical protein
MLRVALAYAWKCSPAAMRDVTIAEAGAMIEFLEHIERGERP